MAAADKQGAFIFWNHPGWKPEHKGWFDIHTTLYERKYLCGIEVVNGDSYDPESHEWALSKNLTFLGNSDIHQPAGLEEGPQVRSFALGSPDMPAGGHRPMTFVFVKERSIPAIKEALIAGRTAIWFENKVIGRKEYAESLFKAAVRVTDAEREGKKVVRFTVRNDSDLPVELQRAGKLGPKEVNLPPNTSARVKIDTSSDQEQIDLIYMADNFLVAPKKGMPVKLLIAPDLTMDIKVDVPLTSIVP